MQADLGANACLAASGRSKPEETPAGVSGGTAGLRNWPRMFPSCKFPALDCRGFLPQASSPPRVSIEIGFNTAHTSLARGPISRMSARNPLTGIIATLRGEHRFISFDELRAHHASLDAVLERLRADPFVEICQLNQPQAKALQQYSPHAADHFPVAMLPQLVPLHVIEDAPSSALGASRSAALQSVDEALEANELAEREAGTIVDCMRCAPR
jgi:hypothetical protein